MMQYMNILDIQLFNLIHYIGNQALSDEDIEKKVDAYIDNIENKNKGPHRREEEAYQANVDQVYSSKSKKSFNPAILFMLFPLIIVLAAIFSPSFNIQKKRINTPPPITRQIW